MAVLVVAIPLSSHIMAILLLSEMGALLAAAVLLMPRYVQVTLVCAVRCAMRCFQLSWIPFTLRYGDDSGGYKHNLKLPTATPAEPTPILLSPRESEPEKKHEASWYDDEVID